MPEFKRDRARMPRVLRRVGATALTVTLLAGATSPGVAAANAMAPPTTAVGQDRPELQDAVQDAVDFGFLGAQMRVHDEQGDWAGSAGARKLGGSVAPSTDGLFRVGSATKAFTSTVVLQLVDEGEVGLDAPAADYLPEFDLDERITVRMLLQHTSGVFNHTGEYYGGTFRPGIPWDGKEWVEKRFHTYQPEELVELSLSKSPVFEPGADWSYSNTNYVLARLLIENVTGHSYAHEVQQRIVRPLGLSDTVAPGTWSGIPGPHAHAYYRYEDAGQWKVVDVTRQNPSWISSAGEMISTTRDLSTFLSALLDGRLLSDELLDEMLTPDPRSQVGYGLGLSVMDYGPGCGGTVVNINGSINGYGALTYSTLDGAKAFSASITAGDASVDFAEAGGKAVDRLFRSVFCTGPAESGQGLS